MFYLMTEALRQLAARSEREEGQTMAEYGLLVALIAVVAAVGAATLGGTINSLLAGISFTSS